MMEAVAVTHTRFCQARKRRSRQAGGLIKDRLGTHGVSVAAIGVAGENLVHFACVNADWSRNAGRTGIGAVIEGYEKGILSLDDLDGEAMTWGNEDAILKLIGKIACREGIGDILADSEAAKCSRCKGDRTAWFYGLTGPKISEVRRSLAASPLDGVRASWSNWSHPFSGVNHRLKPAQ